MPSAKHEALVDLFRQWPALAADLLTASFAVPLPQFDHVRLDDADLPDVVPTQFRADTVIALTSAERPDRSLAAIIVEVQLNQDPVKCWSWPAYLGTLRARLRCPVSLLVVCAERKAARWAATPISLGHPGLVLTPLVLGPDRVPVIDADQAVQAPELAILAALVHGDQEDEQDRVFDAFLAALHALDKTGSPLVTDYHDLVLAALSEAARHHLETLMSTSTHYPRSDFARRHFAEGEAEGEVKGEATALLEVLSVRGIELSEANRKRINECTDIGQLTAWIRSAVTATTADEIFKA